MTSINISSCQGIHSRARGLASLALVFTATLFLSALLLFSVQPMFTKMVLPVLGGSPGVWSIAMVFFQALLLAGYLYAHMLARYFTLRTAGLIHLAICTLALFALPVSANAARAGAPESGQALWLIGVFAVSTGLPFFALSANGPLLQAWFSRTHHPRAANPYFLYGASNIGSFAALLAYPFLIEPFAGLRQQSEIWTMGYVLLALLLATCAFLTLRFSAQTIAPASSARESRTTVEIPQMRGKALRRFAGWAALAAVPSGLLVAVTAHISTDIAAAPLLWVLPLALYLLTFVIVFRDRLPIEATHMHLPLIACVAVILLTSGGGSSHVVIGLFINLAFFLLASLIAHRTLYLARPHASDLTLFYVAMSLGGVIGGLFAGLVAPMIFPSVWEYPLLAVASVFCLPGFAARLREGSRLSTLFSIAGVIVILGAALLLSGILAPPGQMRVLAATAMSVLIIAFWRSPKHVAVFAVGGILAATAFQQLTIERQTMRSFFGVHKIREIVDGKNKLRVLMHGTTMHGSTMIENQPGVRPEPTSYYAAKGAIVEALSAVRAARGGLQEIYTIGLGAGALACHAKSGEAMTFFEIDPMVEKIARDPALFPFLTQCTPDAVIHIGDARLTLSKQERKASVIVVDAFSSDAIPVHLLTVEAIGLYLSKLDNDGAIIFHISNNVLNIAPVIVRAAAEHGLLMWDRTDITPKGISRFKHASSRAMIAVRQARHAGALTTSGRWTPVAPDMKRTPWSDDYSTILEPIADHWRRRANIRAGYRKNRPLTTAQHAHATGMK